MTKTLTFQLNCTYEVIGDFTEGPLPFGIIPDEMKMRKIVFTLNTMMERRQMKKNAPIRNVVFDYRPVEAAALPLEDAGYQPTLDAAFHWIEPYLETTYG